MNYKIVDGPTLGKKLLERIGDQQAKVNLAIAFIGHGAVDLLGGTDLDQVRIVCDYTSGGTNPEAVDALLASGAKVRHLDGLHAKIGIIGDAFSFVGSSNLSRNGIGSDPQINRHERVVIFDGVEETIASHWLDMWKASSKISAEMKKAATATWKRRQWRRAMEVIPEGKSNLVDMLKSFPEKLDALNVHMVVDVPLNGAEQKKFEAGQSLVQNQNSAETEAYLDWEELPKQGFLVDFHLKSRTKLCFNKLYVRDTSILKDASLGGETFQAVIKRDDIHGMKLKKRDQKTIKKAFKRYQNDHPSNSCGTWCFPISELAQYLDRPE